MTGNVRSLREKLGYGFIRAKGVDYFFHRDDFSGKWDDLVQDFLYDVDIRVEFEPLSTPKGPRASGVKRLESKI